MGNIDNSHGLMTNLSPQILRVYARLNFLLTSSHPQEGGPLYDYDT